MDGGIER